MPFESKFPSLPIPDVDLWAFLFERKDKGFSDDKGTRDLGILPCVTPKLMFAHSNLLRPVHKALIHICPSKEHSY